MTLENKTDAELRKLAMDMADGKIWTSEHTNGIDSFLILKLMETDQLKELLADGVALVYEYIEKAGPIAVNGFPTFLSCNFLKNDDATKVFEYYREFKTAKAALLNAHS